MGSEVQQTLDGRELDLEWPDCEYYKGCRGDVTHVAELLENYERMVDVPVCESCVREILETVPEDRVRELSVTDRLRLTGEVSDRD